MRCSLLAPRARFLSMITEILGLMEITMLIYFDWLLMRRTAHCARSRWFYALNIAIPQPVVVIYDVRFIGWPRCAFLYSFFFNFQKGVSPVPVDAPCAPYENIVVLAVCDARRTFALFFFWISIVSRRLCPSKRMGSCIGIMTAVVSACNIYGVRSVHTGGMIIILPSLCIYSGWTFRVVIQQYSHRGFFWG